MYMVAESKVFCWIMVFLYPRLFDHPVNCNIPCRCLPLFDCYPQSLWEFVLYSPLPLIPPTLFVSSLPPSIYLSPSGYQWSIHPSERRRRSPVPPITAPHLSVFAYKHISACLHVRVIRKKSAYSHFLFPIMILDLRSIHMGNEVYILRGLSWNSIANEKNMESVFFMTWEAYICRLLLWKWDIIKSGLSLWWGWNLMRYSAIIQGKIEWTNIYWLEFQINKVLKKVYFDHVFYSPLKCFHALMFKKLFICLILPVLQQLFSPSVWNQNPVSSDWLAGRLLGLVNRLEMSRTLAYDVQCVWALANRSECVT